MRTLKQSSKLIIALPILGALCLVAAISILPSDPYLWHNLPATRSFTMGFLLNNTNGMVGQSRNTVLKLLGQPDKGTAQGLVWKYTVPVLSLDFGLNSALFIWFGPDKNSTGYEYRDSVGDGESR
ncbi:hypothetical protein BH11CYA1_BH11CYA1_46890 [soil metagenome]